MLINPWVQGLMIFRFWGSDDHAHDHHDYEHQRSTWFIGSGEGQEGPFIFDQSYFPQRGLPF